MGNVNITSVGGNTIRSTIVHGQKSVATPGTEVALGASTPISYVTVKALADNTGNVYVGGNPVTASTGYELAPGEAVLVQTNNLANVYIDCEGGNTDGVSFIGA